MKEQKVKHSDPNGKKKKNAGFYIALAICISAIGGAAWTTYSSVLDYQTPKEESSSSSSEREAGKSVSGIEYSKEESRKAEVSEKEANALPESSSSESSKEEYSEDSEENSVHVDNSREDNIVKPLEGKVVKSFSAENPIYSKTMGDWRVHEGIDIAADDGEKVRSYADGVVKEIYNDELFGYTIKIEHTTGIVMLYSGLSPTTLVKVGDSVSAGDYIGAVFTVPSEIMDDTHLHLVAIKDGNIVDAQAVIEQQG